MKTPFNNYDQVGATNDKIQGSQGYQIKQGISLASEVHIYFI